MFDALKNLSRVLPYLYAAVAIVVLWQLALILTGADPALLPPPLLTAETFIEMVLTGEIFMHAGMSLGRVTSSWLLSAMVAIPLGLAMGRFRPFEKVLDPVVEHLLKEAGILKPDDNPKFDASFAINALKQ